MMNLIKYFFFRKILIEFCKWSKNAEWRDGEYKKAFIRNDWDTYIKLFLKEREVKK